MASPSTELPECWASKTAQPKSYSDSTAGKATSLKEGQRPEENKEILHQPLPGLFQEKPKVSPRSQKNQFLSIPSPKTTLGLSITVLSHYLPLNLY